MALMERFASLFSVGKYSHCSSLNLGTSEKGDNLYSQWINSSNLISSQFMAIYLEDEVVTKKKTEPLIKELERMVNQIRSAPATARLLQLELSVLYNILYIRTFNEDGLLNIDGDTDLITQTLHRVIYHHDRRPSVNQDIGELMVTALQQGCEDVILTPLVCICCLWMVLMCRLDKTDQVIQVIYQCLQLQNLQCLELSPLVLLPLPLLLTGEQYVDENSFISDMVSLTAGMMYYETDHLKSRECMERVVSPTYKPYTKYLIASMNYSGGNYVDVLTTLCSLSEDISMTNRVKALHCHLFGMTLSKLDKHQCAIQKYKEALDEDFSFMLPLFMISIEYRSLNLTAAELESLNLLVTALGNSKKSKEHDRNLFTLLIEDTCGQLTLCQVMYFLASRCSQLKMYDDAAQRYLDLLTYIHDNSCSVQISGNRLVEIPRIEKIYLEAVHCLHQAKMYNECIAVCDQVLNCLPSQSQNVSLNCSTQTDLGLLSGDNNLHNISDIICDEVEVKSSQSCTKRKRHQTEESVKDGADDVIISLYKADCFVFLGKIEVGVQCLDRCRERLPFSVDWNQEVKVHRHSKRQRISSDGDATTQTEYSESISDVQKLGSSVYCHVGVAVATRDQSNDALHFLRIGLRLNPGNLNVLYNYVVVLWSVNKKDAAITWCQGRDIETASDSFHLTSLLKQKRNRLRSLTGKDFFRETDIGPSITVTDESLLKLDVLCLNFLIA